jgi:hypothetical protein
MTDLTNQKRMYDREADAKDVNELKGNTIEFELQDGSASR